MRITTSKPDTIQGHIVLDGYPRLGPNTDQDGNRWDIHSWGMKDGKGWCKAVPKGELHGYYTDTSGTSFYDSGTAGSNVISQTWRPYVWSVKESLTNIKKYVNM